MYGVYFSRVYIYYIRLDVLSTFCVTFSKRMNGKCLPTPFIPRDELLSVHHVSRAALLDK